LVLAFFVNSTSLLLINQTDRGSKTAIISQAPLPPSYVLERNIICMRFLRTFLVGLLLASTLALAPETSFARGGGGGGHFGGGRHFGGFHGGFRSRGFGSVHHSYPGFYGYYGPFDYGIDDYAGPYYDDNGAFEVQPPPNDESTSLTMSVQKELTQLGYYRGPIDGIAGFETAQAVRWFQSVNHLPVTGQIDSETIEAMRIG
jgi:hypothetical protein